MRIVLKKSSFVVASALALSLFFNSIVYACSKLAPMSMDLQGSFMSGMDRMDGMNAGKVERGPCAQHKQDVCKSVRDRMLSVQASVSKVEGSQPVVLLPLQPAVEIVEEVVFSPAPFDLEFSYHPVFKRSLPFSFLALRI